MDVLTYLLAQAQSSGSGSGGDTVKVISLIAPEEETTKISESQLGEITVITAEEV